MIGYFFRRNNANILYIPRNLIVIESDEECDVNYYPDNILAYDRIWDSRRYDLLGIKDGFPVKELEIDREMIQRFSDSCFAGEHALAHLRAVDIFIRAEEEVKNGNKV